MLLFGCLSVRVPPSLSRREAMSSPLAAAAAASLAAAGSPWPAAAVVADGVTYDDLPPKAQQAYQQYWPALQLAADSYVFELYDLLPEPGRWDSIGAITESTDIGSAASVSKLEREYLTPMRILALAFPPDAGGEEMQAALNKFQGSMFQLSRLARAGQSLSPLACAPGLRPRRTRAVRVGRRRGTSPRRAPRRLRRSRRRGTTGVPPSTPFLRRMPAPACQLSAARRPSLPPPLPPIPAAAVAFRARPRRSPRPRRPPPHHSAPLPASLRHACGTGAQLGHCRRCVYERQGRAAAGWHSAQGRGLPALQEAVHAAAERRRALPQPRRRGARRPVGQLDGVRHGARRQPLRVRQHGKLFCPVRRVCGRRHVAPELARARSTEPLGGVSGADPFFTLSPNTFLRTTLMLLIV